MKKVLFIALLLPLLSRAQFKIVNNSVSNLVELREGTWPITLQRVTRDSDTSYVLLFRDQHYLDDVIMTTFKFGSADQLKYFQKGLAALKSGNNGDMAKYKDYSIKRVDVKRQGTWYVLNCNDGAVTNFQQTEADKLMAAAASL
jgi:hypothetical protein